MRGIAFTEKPGIKQDPVIACPGTVTKDALCPESVRNVCGFCVGPARIERQQYGADACQRQHHHQIYGAIAHRQADEHAARDRLIEQARTREVNHAVERAIVDRTIPLDDRGLGWRKPGMLAQAQRKSHGISSLNSFTALSRISFRNGPGRKSSALISSTVRPNCSTGKSLPKMTLS